MIRTISLKVINTYKKCIYITPLPQALDIASDYAKIVYKYQLKIYDLSDIEKFLIQKTQATLDLNRGINESKKGTLFVVSCPLSSGGHTRLMENLSKMLPEKNDLLVTRVFENNLEDVLYRYFSGIKKCFRKRSQNSVDHINTLFKELVGYEKIVLNIHPDDISTVIACSLIKKLNKDVKVYFVNHADHVASFGATISDYWFEISLFGKEIDNKRGITGIRSFIGIPIDKPDTMFFNPVKYPSINSVKNFFTSGWLGKYQPYRKASIVPLFRKLLLIKGDISITIIGPSLRGYIWIWPFYFKNNKNIKIISHLPYEEYINLTEKSDYFIDSFPMPGGTAFVEQFIQGIPCIGQKSAFYGYTPLELIKSKTIGEIIELLRAPPTPSQLHTIQKKIYEVHAFSCVKERFIRCIKNGEVSKNPMLSYRKDLETGISVPSRHINLLFSPKLILFRIFLKVFFLKIRYLNLSNSKNAKS